MMTADEDAKFQRDVTAMFYDALAWVRKYAPRDTGNLADKALRGEWQIDRREGFQKKFVIWVDTSGSTKNPLPGKAPYMPFTNEPWISEFWRGKQNPNENWWNDAAEFVYLYLKRRLENYKI